MSFQKKLFLISSAAVFLLAVAHPASADIFSFSYPNLYVKCLGVEGSLDRSDRTYKAGDVLDLTGSFIYNCPAQDTGQFSLYANLDTKRWPNAGQLLYGGIFATFGNDPLSTLYPLSSIPNFLPRGNKMTLDVRPPAMKQVVPFGFGKANGRDSGEAKITVPSGADTLYVNFFAVLKAELDNISSNIYPFYIRPLVSIPITLSDFDFSLSNGGDKSVTAGKLVDNTITASLLSGAAELVTLSATIKDSNGNDVTSKAGGVAPSLFSKSSVTPTDTSVLTLSTAASTPPGIYKVTVTGVTASAVSPAAATPLTHQTEFNLNVLSPTPATCTLSDIGLRVNEGTAASPQIVGVAASTCEISPLKITRDGMVYSVALVPPGDSCAANVMAKTAAGVFALRKLGCSPTGGGGEIETCPTYPDRSGSVIGITSPTLTTGGWVMTLSNPTNHSIYFKRVESAGYGESPGDFSISPHGSVRVSFGTYRLEGNYITPPFRGDNYAVYEYSCDGGAKRFVTYSWDYLH